MADQKGKYQPWSHEEFMADRKVRRMSPTALKTYMMLLHEAFVCSTRPYLPDDEDELEAMGYCTDHEEWLSVRDSVLGMFEKSEIDGIKVLIKNRLTQDWEKLQEIREQRSEAGKAGAKARWDGKNSKTVANDSTPLAKNSKEVSKQVSKESEVSKNSDGQEENMKLKDQLTKIAASHGVKAGGYKTTWDDIKTLGIAYGTGAVSTDFADFMQEYHGDDFPSGAVVSYLKYAADRLTADSAPATTVSRDPLIVNLVRELIYLSGDKVTFQGRHKVQLAELLQSWSSDDLISVFKTFISDKDLNDPYTLKYITSNYLDAADGLAYSTHKRKKESDAAKIQRDETAKRLQEDAESERRQKSEKLKESEIFDPLA